MDTTAEAVQTGRLSLAAAAAQLGVSEKTARRWIKSGRLRATMEDGPYGPQYWVDLQAVQGAQQVLSVVAVERQADPQTLALAVAAMLEQRDAAQRQHMQAALDRLQTQLAAHVETQTATIVARLDTLGQDGRAESPSTPRPWWRRLLGG